MSLLTMTREQRQAARDALTQQYLPVLDRIQREGLEDDLDMEDFYCGTSCCVAGWGAVFSGLTTTILRHAPSASDWSQGITEDLGVDGDLLSVRFSRMFQVLFGETRGSGPTALAKQNRAAMLLLYRLDRLDEEEQRASQPKRERQDHSLLEVPA